MPEALLRQGPPATMFAGGVKVGSEGRRELDTEASSPMRPLAKEPGVHNRWWLYRGTAPPVGDPATTAGGMQRVAQPADDFRRPSQAVRGGIRRASCPSSV